MITYDSQDWRTLLQMKGSVFPQAAMGAFGSSLLAMVLVLLQDYGIISISNGVDDRVFLLNSAAYSGFSLVLGFILVFRTNQCYSRFWTCATSCCTFRAQLVEACSSLVTFTMMSKASADEIWMFKHQLIRLFSMFHALGLEAIADMRNENFKIIDVENISEETLKILSGLRDRQKAELVYQWINALVVQSIDNGLLNVPAPILSRVFQELEKAQIEYQQVLQIVDLPFPFPFAQVSAFLCFAYLVFTPFVMLFWSSHVIGAMLFTFISSFALLCIECIATQLETPCGDDPNDLPCHTFQSELNDSLLALLGPHAFDIIKLTPQAKLSYYDLVHMADDDRKSLVQCDVHHGLPTQQVSVSQKMDLMDRKSNGILQNGPQQLIDNLERLTAPDPLLKTKDGSGAGGTIASLVVPPRKYESGSEQSWGGKASCWSNLMLEQVGGITSSRGDLLEGCRVRTPSRLLPPTTPLTKVINQVDVLQMGLHVEQLHMSVQLLAQCSESLRELSGRRDPTSERSSSSTGNLIQEDDFSWPERLLQQQGAIHKEIMDGLSRLLDKIDTYGVPQQARVIEDPGRQQKATEVQIKRSQWSQTASSCSGCPGLSNNV